MTRFSKTLLILTATQGLLIGCSGSEEATDTDGIQQSLVQTAAATPDTNNANNADDSDQNTTQTFANEPVTTRSPQGIDGDGDRRRQDARNRRNNNNNNNDNQNNNNQNNLQAVEARSYDGSDNNQNNSDWGATFSHLQRLAPAAYADSVSTMAGENRPNARFISTALATQGEDEVIPNTFGTSDYTWQWGQFLDHDINLTDGSDFESANIAVPTGDLWFDPLGTGEVVIPFSRALFDPDTGTDPSNPREQENEITSWIDGSMVYGSSVERLNELRVGTDSPFLKTSEGNLLPFNVNGISNANGFITDPSSLFLAGDVRANEQAGLAAMHTLFVREHNRLAAELQEDNPQSSAQEVFEAARRLVVAKIQIITYQEHLPALLGNGAIPTYTGYRPDVNGTIFNEFSAAAYRLGHSMVNDNVLRLDNDGSVIDAGNLSLRNAFFTAPQLLNSENSIDPILRGLAAQRHQKIDLQIVDTLRNFLFGQPGAGGFDLTALNIQRGRDHGLASYNDTRAALGLERYNSFSDISSDAEVVENLESVYASVDGIDLWIGGLAEDTVAGSQLGELFQTILVRQFTALRDGDRFWYQNYLSNDELDDVRGTTLARVIRANTDIGNELQDNVFFVDN